MSVPGVVSFSAVKSNSCSFMSESFDTHRTSRASSDLF